MWQGNHGQYWNNNERALEQVRKTYQQTAIYWKHASWVNLTVAALHWLFKCNRSCILISSNMHSSQIISRHVFKERGHSNWLVQLQVEKDWFSVSLKTTAKHVILCRYQAVCTCRLLSPRFLTSSSSLSSSSLGSTDTQDRADMSELSEADRRPVDCHSSLSFSDS